MDIEVTLAKLRELTRIIMAAIDDDSNSIATGIEQEFAEHFQALDDWLKMGGFLPQSWQQLR